MTRLAIALAVAFAGILAAALLTLTACAATEAGTAPSNPSPVPVIEICDSAPVPEGPDSTLVCKGHVTRGEPQAP